MKEITIQGVAHPLHFGLRALCDFTKAQDTDFDTTVTSAQALGSLDSIVGLTVTGLNEGARRTNSDRRYTEDEVWDFFDDEPELILGSGQTPSRDAQQAVSVGGEDKTMQLVTGSFAQRGGPDFSLYLDTSVFLSTEMDGKCCFARADDASMDAYLEIGYHPGADAQTLAGTILNDYGTIATTESLGQVKLGDLNAYGVNGAMLYDRHMMQPLFKLSIGNPGSSFAIEIARKIGLPEDVIADASEKVGSDYIDMDKYLQDIVRDKRYWENKRQNIRHQEKQLEEITQRYADNLQEIEKERKRILKEAKQKAEQLIAESNARIENTIRAIKEAEAEKEKTKMARQELHSFKKGLQKNDENDDAISRKIAKIKAKEEKKNHSKKEADAETSKTTTISVGDAVCLKGQTTVGEISAIQGNKATVIFGHIKSSVHIERLEKVSRNRLKREQAIKATFVSEDTTNSMREKSLHFHREIDIRGFRADEALQALVYFIDDAIQVGAEQVRILHGTGTGALRQTVREYLKGATGIRSFHDEHVQFGGAGITVVELE